MTSRPVARHPHPHLLAASLPRKIPDARIRYGEASPVQFADLRLPKKTPPAGGFPVVIFVHGGGWLADWSKDYATPFVEALTETGVATWDIEFRRLGNRNGGYPGTFQDVGLAADHLRNLALKYALNINKVIAVGHSTGGHLALWLAGRGNLPLNSLTFSADPIALKGVVSLGGVNDLEHSLTRGSRTDIHDLLGIHSSQVAELFTETSPACLLPFKIPQILIAGTLEDDWRREMTRVYAEKARACGDIIRLMEPADIDHFDLVDPLGPALSLVADAIKTLIDL
ncbi:alpha/beta hydrolase [Ochrobactrum chromiisoli]|uniref:Alpha/beta hydrolase n=1 Tax=Ochrobactrum chromiisoli TaxID=2993941 RepID=A0ABT3QKU1_9HYPH|nr:alpha/beta hydrolase [Ochrobactrum chromiisoli]MCX2696212.1 alpha/beta hydrolase [Ochrobactrum chromiisoli]